MRHFITILILAVLLAPSIVSAKRGPLPKVDPVDYQGVRYTPHSESGQRECVRASDLKTGKELWDVTVFSTVIDPRMEEDVQWVFIKQMFIDDDKLIVVAEDGRGYGVDLRSHTVKKLKHVPKNPSA